ncbi:uncharacterized protein LOC131328409 [Rhododendron vialii]|uniref:uncharacterized protein LOC131328409 n=1 Tax=Rhododendron vialii TaxID=182163 RepID=UPI00265DA085|nr:uncharacterized protein LOC131328409 [Rhododendron vialii]
MDYETRYTSLEKTYWGLVWPTKKLRHYLLAHLVVLVSLLDPIKYLFEKPALIGKLTRWLLLAEFDHKYMTRKSVKGRAVAEFLADHPMTEAKVEDFMFLDEDILFLLGETWQLYFDGTSIQCGYGIGVLLVSPNDFHIPLSYKLRFEVTSNQAEYEACIAGMDAALELGAKRVEVIGELNLVVSQQRGDWKVKENTQKLYHSMLEALIPQFGSPLMIKQKVKPTCECTFTKEGEDDGKPWYEDVKKFLEEGEYSSEATSKDKMALRKFAA